MKLKYHLSNWHFLGLFFLILLVFSHVGSARTEIGDYIKTSYIQADGGNITNVNLDWTKPITFQSSASNSDGFKYNPATNEAYFGSNVNSPYYVDNPIWGLGQLQVRQQGDFAKIRLTSVGGYRSWLAFDYARGTFASPSGALNNDVVSSIVGVVYDGISSTSYHQNQIDFVSDENNDANHHGSRIDFWTIPKFSTTQTKVLSLTSDSNISVIQPGKGIILKSPDSTKCGLLSWGNDNILKSEVIPCP